MLATGPCCIHAQGSCSPSAKPLGGGDLRPGALNLGVQKTNYRKTVATPETRLPSSRARPWLFNASAAIDLSKPCLLYTF